MVENEIVFPTKDEVIKLLTIAKNDGIIHIKSVGELLGMKWLDSLMPKIKGEPEWGFEGLSRFFAACDIETSCSLEDALKKLSV